MPTTTPYLSLTLPDIGQYNWGGFNNGDLSILDGYLSTQGSNFSVVSNQVSSLLLSTVNIQGSVGAISFFGNNITLSQNNSSITISAAAQSIQTQNTAAINGSTGSIVVTAGNNITLSQNASTITINAANQTVQTQNVHDLTLAGNTTGTLALVSSGTLTLAGGNNITLSQNGNAITIEGNAGGGGAFTAGVSGGNTSGTSGTIGSEFVLAGGNNITLSAATAAGGVMSVTISGPNTAAQTNQTLGVYASSQTVGQSSSSTVDVRSLTVVGQGIVSAGLSAGSVLISATVPAQSVQTQNLVSVNGSTGNISLVAGANISLAQNASTITISASNQSVQTQNLVDVSLSGNTAGALALISSGTAVFAGGNNITLSQNGQSVTISGPNTAAQTNQTVGIYASSQTVGQSSSSTVDARSFTHVGQGIVSVGLSGGSLLISATTAAQSVQTQNLVDVSLSGNTSGALALVSSGTLILAGGNNITLSQNGQSVTISGPNAAGAQTGISAVIVSNTTYTSGTISFVNSNGISFGSSGANGISASYTVPTQSNQTLGIYASSQTVGQSSSSTLDARSFTHVGQGIVSVGMSGGSLLISATTPSQTAQTVGIYASSQTVGQSSSSTVDARSFTHVGQGIVSVGLSAGSLLISATTAQSVQTQNLIDVSLSGNTTGTLALVSSGTLIIAGGNNITLSQNGQSVTISGANAAGAQTGISGVIVSNTTYTSGTISFVNSNGISFGSSGANGISASYTVPVQTNQTLSFALSSQTVGNTSGVSIDARSLTIQGMGAVSVGASTSAAGTSLLISAPNTIAQTNQSIGFYGSSQTTGQSSSTTLDARSVTLVGQGIVSVGASAGSLLVSATTSQSVQTQNLIDVSLSGNTTGTLALVSSGTLILAGGNNITLSQNGQSVTISGPNVGGAQTGISGIIVSNTTYTSGTISFVNSNGISFGSSGANGISASYTVPTQSNQTLSFAATGNTTGNTSGISVDARSLTLQGLGSASVGFSTSAGGTSLLVSMSQTVQTQNLMTVNNTQGSITISGGANITVGNNASTITISAAAQSVQSIGLYASSQTYGQSSSSTIDARSLSVVAQGAISAGLSAGSLILSVAPGVQSNQTLSYAATGNTAGNTSGVTVDARSLTLQGLGIASVGMSTSAGGTSFIVSASQTVQTQNLMTVNGTQGSVTISGGANVTVGNNASTITISVAAQSNQTLSAAFTSQTVGNTSGVSVDARSLTLQGMGAVSVGASTSAGGTSFLISAPNTIAQTNQTIGLYASSQTVGQSSSSTIDARSLTVVGQGIVSAGLSAGSLLVSATTAAQTNQTIGFYASSQTTGQSSSSTVDARSITVVGQGIISAGLSAGSLLVSATTVAQTNQTLGIYASSQTVGQSSSSTIDARSVTYVGQGVVSVGMSGGSVLISAPSGAAFSAGFSTQGNTSGNTGIVGNELLLVGGNNITLSGSTNAGSITVSLSAPSISTAQLFITGNTTGTTAALSTGSIYFAGGNNITLSQAGGQVVTISANNEMPVGLSNIGNTLGNTGVLTGQLVFAGGNNITLSGSTVAGQSGTITISAANQSVQTQNCVDISLAGNSTSAGAGYILISSGTAILAGGNNITLSQNGQSVTISGPNTAAQTNQTIGLYASSQTYGQSSSSTVDARSLTIVGQGILSAGMSGGSLVLSVPSGGGAAVSIGMSTMGNTSGTTGTFTNQYIFAGTNNLTLSQSTGAGGATLTISGPTISTAQLFITGNTTGTTAALSAGSIYFAGGNNITISQASNNTITISGPSSATIPYCDPVPIRGSTFVSTLNPGTMYVQPFILDANYSAVRLQFLQSGSSQSATTFSVSASISAGNASSGTGSCGYSGSLILMTRVSTGTAAASSQLVSFYTNSYSYGIGNSVSVSWSTNASSASASYTTSGAITFISQINSAGAVTTGSFGTSGSSTFSSTGAGAGSFSSSFSNSFGSQMLVSLRPLVAPFATSMLAGEYWLGFIFSQATGSTNYSLQRLCSVSTAAFAYSSNTQGYLPFGSTVTTNNSNIQQGWGSYGTSANTSTTIAITAISNMSQYQTWFNMMAYSQ